MNKWEQSARQRKVKKLVKAVFARPMAQVDDESLVQIASESGVNKPSELTCEMVRMVLVVMERGLSEEAA